jgi:hypothetical protein
METRIPCSCRWIAICYDCRTEYAHLFHRLEATAIASAIAQSVLLTGLLSATHLVGMTLVGGGALVSGLYRIGILFPDQPDTEIAATARRLITAGVVVSITTGVLLFAARASTASVNGIFQLKMLLLVTALAFHATSRGSAFASLLWYAVIGAGCAFILLE